MTRVTYDNHFKTLSNLAILTYCLTEPSESSYKLLLLQILASCLFDSDLDVDFSSTSSKDTLYALCPHYKLKLNELTVDLIRISNVDQTSPTSIKLVRICNDILLALSAVVNFEEDKFVCFALD